MANKVHVAGVLFENENGQILVLKRHPDKPEGETWGLVAGKLGPDEDAVTAVIREAKEEIGQTLKKDELEFIKS